MRHALLITGLVVVQSACAPAALPPPPETRSADVEQSLMQADRDFETATHARRIDGWMSFMAADALRIPYRGSMVRGYDAIRKADSAGINDTTATLNWQPVEAHAYSGGSLGVTLGKYQVVSGKTADAGKVLGQGRYITTWRRASDGRWLVIMDTGYREPGP